MLFPLNFFASFLFLFIISISHQNAVDEPTWTTKISEGFDMMLKKADEMVDAATDIYQEMSTNVGQNVITFGQDVITFGQDVIGKTVTEIFDFNSLKPVFVEHLCTKTDESLKDDKFEKYHKLLKEFCVQLIDEDKSIEEAAEYVQKTMEKTNFVLEPEILEEFNQKIQNDPSINSENKELLGQFIAAMKKFLPTINAKNCSTCAAAVAAAPDNRPNNLFRCRCSKARRVKRSGWEESTCFKGYRASRWAFVLAIVFFVSAYAVFAFASGPSWLLYLIIAGFSCAGPLAFYSLYLCLKESDNRSTARRKITNCEALRLCCCGCCCDDCYD